MESECDLGKEDTCHGSMVIRCAGSFQCAMGVEVGTCHGSIPSA
jgi:hypothetical protein